LCDSRLRFRAVAADQRIAVERMTEVRQRLRAERMKRRHHRHAWNQPRRLLRGRAIPQRQRAREAASDGDFERNGRIHQNCSRRDAAANRLQGFHLSGERHGKNHDAGRRHGLSIRMARYLGRLGLLANPSRRVLRLFEVAGADAHAHPGMGKAQRQSAALRSRAAHHCNSCLHAYFLK
jgi:hypothetical protein